MISFVVVGIFWVAHHTQFHFIRHTNRRHIWINILLLLWVSFLPFSAALLGERPRFRTAVVLYAANMMAAGGSLRSTGGTPLTDAGWSSRPWTSG